MERILIIEDDESIKTELITLLQTNGYKTVDEMPCELALLDINLLGESGFTICRKIREKSNIPIIFLTARNTPEDELLAFGVGGDDFIQKPYNSAVLLARIGRLLKRKESTELSTKGITLNIKDMKVKYQEQTCELTKNETRILAFLMENEVCHKEDIIEELWTNSLYIDENTLYVNIARLREKLAGIGAKQLIHNIRGVGYRL